MSALSALIAKAKAKAASQSGTIPSYASGSSERKSVQISSEPCEQERKTSQIPQTSIPPQIPMVNGNHNGNGNPHANPAITYNSEQQSFIDAAICGKSSVLIGAAGTGKTTCMKGMISQILSSSRHIPTLQEAHKYLQVGTPGIVACSFTRRAVANLRKAMPDDMKNNCITIHKLLEYQPTYYEIIDPETGAPKTTMRFEPQRTALNPLDPNIKILIIDESSMVSLELYNLLKAALPHTVQFIYLGDIQQLPPVFGSAILGYKMIEHADTTVELKQVYRQALESPIIRLAHRILSGNPIPAGEYPEWKVQDKLTIHPWKKKIHAESALLTLAAFIKQAYDTANYNPEEDMILIPFNKSCGTDELNKHIANHIARKNHKVTYEVIAGFNKKYFSIGDRILYDKEDAEILSISHNGLYSGKWPQKESTKLDYWGHLHSESQTENIDSERQEAEIDQMLAVMARGLSESESTVREASHIIVIRMVETGDEITLNTAGEINSLLLSYALTVHKSQGSEWRKVFCFFHQSHATMILRELLYTAVTRAREELYVICEPDTFTKGILNQRIKGNTLSEKAEYFKGRIDSQAE